MHENTNVVFVYENKYTNMPSANSIGFALL